MQNLIVKYWNTYLDLIPANKKDIYFTEEYAKLYENKDRKALCYVCIDDAYILLMPFIREKIDEFFDFETPYGYGGPITNSMDSSWIIMALTEMKKYFMMEGYVAGFIRFHPLLKNADFCQCLLNVCFDRGTVIVDLSKPSDEIWSCQISSKNRNMIRKAEKSDFSFDADFEYNNIDQFIQLYNSTMRRVFADTFHYFQKKYYSEFTNKLKGRSFLGLIKKDDSIVAAALFMYDFEYGHYHLAGSDLKFSGTGINNLLLWSAIKTLKESGVKQFHLGGGTSSDPENSLYKFKKSFSPNRGDFYIGRLIFNQEKYKSLCTNWENNNLDKADLYKNYLLKYRM